MVDAGAMRQGHMSIGAGQYIDTEEKYLVAMPILPYCPQADCGAGDRSAMAYFRTYRELNKHVQLLHPEV